MKSKAIFSECEKYRYVLRRYFDTNKYKPILFIMLNPSTADAMKDDPTIRKCINFAKREKASELTIVNLFALRSTNPKKLFEDKDIVGPDNITYIMKEIEIHNEHLIIAAWGNNILASFAALKILPRVKKLYCLGKNKNGSPKHPLYLKKDAELSLFFE